MQKEFHNSQIGATDTNVDDSGELLAGETSPLTAADLFRKLLHVLEDIVDTARDIHDILAVNLHFPAANVAQSSVEDGTVLSKVDLVTTEHGITLSLNASLVGELGQQLEGLISQEILAKVKENIVGGSGSLEHAGEAAEAIRVRRKRILEDEALADGVAMSTELSPGGQSVCGSHCGWVRLTLLG